MKGVLTAVACCLSVAMPLCAQPKAQPPEGTGEVGVLEVVVVTATKRNTTLQEATQCAMVLQPEDTFGMQSGLDVFSLIPNTTMFQEGVLPSVRGSDGNGTAIGGGGAVTGSNPRMSNYVDGVARPFSALPAGVGGLWDMQQIEILRGAQSTTFGQNALAGALVQVTNDPVFEDEFAVRAGIRSDETTYSGSLLLQGAFSEVALAVPTALLGVWAAHNDRVSATLRPINDTLQTMPQFVILIPVLMLMPKRVIQLHRKPNSTRHF